LNRKSQKATLIVLFFTCILIVTPMAASATRGTYLTNFILANQDENDVFGDSYEETSYALEILNDFGILSSIDTQSLQIYLQNTIQKEFDNNNMNVYNLYYLLNSLNLLIPSGELVNSSLKNNILNFLDGTNQTGGGFSLTNSSDTSGLISTYFAIYAYNIIDNSIAINDIHKDWILNCRNSADGGYGGNASLPSTLICTYFAISSLSLDSIDAINEIVNLSDTINYLTSFYISESSNQNNYGGYIPDEDAEITLLSSTYYCTSSLTIISTSSSLETAAITNNWVYSRQNVKDGGFVDKNTKSTQTYSSIISSYFALKTIILLGGNFDGQILMVEFNWIALIIVLSCIGAIIAIGIYFWRKRRI